MSEPERRLTPTERLYELAMAQAVRPPAAPEHSVDVTRNAKGQWQLAVTIRGHDADEVYATAVRIARLLEAEYPFDNGGGA